MPGITSQKTVCIEMSWSDQQFKPQIYSINSDAKL